MNPADLLKPGTVTIITDSPACYLRWSVEHANDPAITVILCEDAADLSAPAPAPPAEDDEPDPRQAQADDPVDDHPNAPWPIETRQPLPPELDPFDEDDDSGPWARHTEDAT